MVKKAEQAAPEPTQEGQNAPTEETESNTQVPETTPETVAAVVPESNSNSALEIVAQSTTLVLYREEDAYVLYEKRGDGPVKRGELSLIKLQSYDSKQEASKTFNTLRRIALTRKTNIAFSQ